MITSTAFLFALAAMLLWSVGDFLLHKTSKKIGGLETFLFVNLLGSIVLFPFVAGSITDLSLDQLVTLLILAFFDLAFGLAILKAYEQGKLGVIEVVMTLELPLTVLFGIIFLKERLTGIQILLLIIILAGIFFISSESRKFYQKLLALVFRHQSRWEKGLALALLAAFFSSFYNFFIAINSRGVSPLMTIWLPWTASLIALSIYYFSRKGLATGFASLVEKAMKYKRIIIAGSIIDVFAWFFYASAVGRQDLAIITAITESYPALTIFYGVRFNKEKISAMQYFGAILAIGGSLAMIFVS